MNACEVTCKEECQCKLCMINLYCTSANWCLKYPQNSIADNKCAGYTDWLTKITDPLHWEKSLDFIKDRDKKVVKENKKFQEKIINYNIGKS